jgi:hypothetical protein
VTTKVLSSSPISRARRKATAPPTAASCGRTNRQAAIQLEISPHRDGHRFESPQLHQEVRTKRRDFLLVSCERAGGRRQEPGVPGALQRLYECLLCEPFASASCRIAPPRGIELGEGEPGAQFESLDKDAPSKAGTNIRLRRRVRLAR